MGSQPVFVSLAKVAGLAPYRRSPGGEYEASPAREWATLVFLSALSIYSVNPLILPELLAEGTSHSTVQRHALIVVFIATLAHDVILVVTLRARQFQGYMEVLNSPEFQADAILPRPGRSWLPYLVTGSYASGTMVDIVCRSIVSGETSIFKLLQHLALFYTVLVKSVTAGLFAFLLDGVSLRVGRLNQDLQQMNDDENVITAEKVVAIRQKYKEAVQLTKKICFWFGPQILTDLLQDLWWITRQAFFITNTKTSPLLMVGSVVDALKSLVSKATLILVTHKLASMGSNTLSCIHVLRNSRWHPMNPRQELEEFSHQVSQEPLVVSLCGVTELNLGLLFQAAGVALTYVIVLTQFQNS